MPQLTHLSMGNATYGNEQRLSIHLGPEEIMQVAPSVYMLRTRQPLSQELLLFSHYGNILLPVFHYLHFSYV